MTKKLDWKIQAKRSEDKGSPGNGVWNLNSFSDN
jgi:hypothetical protein